jgi:hypothetical protein
MFVLIHRYVTSTFNYFSDQGIPGPKPMPFFGNMWGIWKSVRWPPWNIINSFHITIIIMITESSRVRHVIGEKAWQSVRLLWRTATEPVDNRLGIDQGHLCQRFWSFCWPQSKFFYYCLDNKLLLPHSCKGEILFFFSIFLIRHLTSKRKLSGNGWQS